jgi:hypothetical protein
MRQLPHFPPQIPHEPLFLRRIYLPPNGGPREDELLELDWNINRLTNAHADVILRDDLTNSRAHGVRLETKDGGIVRLWSVWHVIRERFGIEQLRCGDKERIAVLMPELPPL